MGAAKRAAGDLCFESRAQRLVWGCEFLVNLNFLSQDFSLSFGSGPSISFWRPYAFAWKRDVIDHTELASKRWVEKMSMDRIAAEMGWRRTAVFRNLGKIRANPGLGEDGQVRLRIHRRKHRVMGKGG